MCWLLFSESVSPVNWDEESVLLLSEQLFSLEREQHEELLVFGEGIVVFMGVWNFRSVWMW